MLTDEELSARLGAALRDSVPEMTYAGPVPQVRRGGGGLAATSVLAAAATVVVVPVIFERGESPSPRVEPSVSAGTNQTASPGRTVIRTLEVAGLRLTYAQVDGLPGALYFVLGNDLSVPSGAEKLDLDTPGNVEVWFVDDAAAGQPQMYVKPRFSPTLYGLFGEGWTREQLIFLLEHPLAAQRGQE